MDTIKILLGITVALLLGALAMSWKNFRQDVRGTPPEELAQLQRQIAEIRSEQERLREERDGVIHGKPAEPAAPGESVPPAEVPPMADIPETGAVFPDEEMTAPEASRVAPPVPGADERAAAIAAAPVVAKLAEWVEDPQIGSFATLQVTDAAVVKAGAIVCVRRGTGILGRLQVSEVTPEGALANAVSVFGEVKPKAGDELIVEP